MSKQGKQAQFDPSKATVSGSGQVQPKGGSESKSESEPIVPTGDGGPAFPTLKHLVSGHMEGYGLGQVAHVVGGASLLDLFTAAALASGKTPAEAVKAAEEALRERAKRQQKQGPISL